MLIQHSLEPIEAVQDQDIGIEVVNSAGAMAGGDVLESSPLHGRAKLDQPVLEDPRSNVLDGQVADIDDAIEWCRDGRRALRHLVAEDEVKHRLGMDPLDRVRQRRRLGQIICGDASENVHASPFARSAVVAATGSTVAAGWRKEPRSFLGREAVIRTENVAIAGRRWRGRRGRAGRQIPRRRQQGFVDRGSEPCPEEAPGPSPSARNRLAWAPRSKQIVYSPDAMTAESVYMKVSGQSDGRKAMWHRAAANRE